MQMSCYECRTAARVVSNLVLRILLHFDIIVGCSDCKGLAHLEASDGKPRLAVYLVLVGVIIAFTFRGQVTEGHGYTAATGIDEDEDTVLIEKGEYPVIPGRSPPPQHRELEVEVRGRVSPGRISPNSALSECSPRRPTPLAVDEIDGRVRRRSSV
jgi:hypothetical protein